MNRILGGKWYRLVVILCLALIAPTALANSGVVENVAWVHTEDFSGYAVGEFPTANWTTMVAERKATWSVVEFPQAESGYALRGSNVGFNPNRAILLVDIPQASIGKIVFETRLWLDGGGLPGIDLFDTKHSWPNYMSVHPWNLGRFASGSSLQPYDVTAIFDLASKSVDVYIDGQLFKGDMAFRSGQQPPASGLYHLGVVFNNDNNATDLYYESIRIGVAE